MWYDYWASLLYIVGEVDTLGELFGYGIPDMLISYGCEAYCYFAI